MTERAHGRIDLRSLGLDHDTAQIDAAIRATMQELHHARLLVRTQRALLAVAAVLVAIAAATIVRSPRDTNRDADFVTRWAETGHTPTNGELLTAYHGYRP